MKLKADFAIRICIDTCVCKNSILSAQEKNVDWVESPCKEDMSTFYFYSESLMGHTFHYGGFLAPIRLCSLRLLVSQLEASDQFADILFN